MKAKKIMIITALTAVICSLLLSFTACKSERNDGEDPKKTAFSVSYNAKHFVCSSGDASVTKIIDSMQSLRETDEKQGNRIFGDDGNLYYGEEYIELMKGYDDAFFEEKEILYVIISLSHYEERSLKTVELIDGELVATIEKPRFEEDADFAAVITNHIFVIELDKTIGKPPVAVNAVEKAE